MGCFACCVPCDPCDAVCDETPPENFGTVYQANDTDGSLQWSGDAMGPIDGPFPGFNGPGSFSQSLEQATGFSVLLPGDRFPCAFRVQFWRNVSGGTGSDALTGQFVRISCITGKVDLGIIVLSAGQSVEWTTTPDQSDATYIFDAPPVPLVAGDEDQSGSPPPGWFGGVALCDQTTIGVSAGIVWDNADIQHSLYGRFLECFDADCPLPCDGGEQDAPENVYLSITNVSENGFASGVNPPDMAGEYTLPLLRNCREYADRFSVSGGDLVAYCNFHLQIRMQFTAQGGDQYAHFAVFFTRDEWLDFLCGVTASLSGSGTMNTSFTQGTISFDWELTL